MPCTTVLAGKLATNDRSTMIARTDDGHFDEKKLIVVEPDQQPKIYKSVESHVEITLPENIPISPIFVGRRRDCRACFTASAMASVQMGSWVFSKMTHSLSGFLIVFLLL